MDKTSSQYSQDIADKDSEIAEAIRVKEEVRQAILTLRKQKIELDVALSKAQYNYEKLKIERSLLVHHFYSCKEQGL